MTSSRSSHCSVAAALFIGALVLAVEAARNYSLPNLLGFSGSDVTHEMDFWCSLLSGALAIGASLVARRASWARPATTGERIYSGFAFLGLTALFFAIWLSYVLYYAFWIAPTHAIAVTMLFICLQRRREEHGRHIAGFRESRTP